MDVKLMECCGLREIDGLYSVGNPQRALENIIALVELDDDNPTPGDWPFGAMIFTEAGSGRYGTRFAAFLKENRLGAVRVIPAFYNPNSGNNVRTFVWTVNHLRLRKWYYKERVRN